jgi:hypothetical protein
MKDNEFLADLMASVSNQLTAAANDAQNCSYAENSTHEKVEDWLDAINDLVRRAEETLRGVQETYSKDCIRSFEL